MVAALTKSEKAWRDSLNSGRIKKNFDALIQRQALPLDEKIELSKQRIREWYEAWGGDVSVSFSGGLDSTVLLWLVRQVKPDIPGVFCNTGLEYPEIVKHVKQTENVEIVRPSMPFNQVIERYGWPVVSKKVARGLSFLRDPEKADLFIYRLYDKGINRFEEPVNGFRVPDRWRFLIDAPFPISDKCCDIMKKRPMEKYVRKTGRYQMLGTLADESKNRQKAYIRYGCNAFDLKKPRSTPIAFWTKQDVLECIVRFSIPYASVYGEIEKRGDTYHCTGAERTGCVFCCFGLALDEMPTRFQKLHDTHPALWNYCMDKLGLRGVLSYMHERVPEKLKKQFTPEPLSCVQRDFAFMQKESSK